MHELSIAISIVELAEEEAGRSGTQIIAVHLKLGAFSGVVKEALLASYEMACDDSPLKGSHLVIEEVPVIVFCSSCQGRSGPSVPFNYSVAPQCGTPTSAILQGKEIEVVALEIEECPSPV